MYSTREAAHASIIRSTSADAKGATGNVATEDVVFLLNGLGIETGIDLDRLVDAGAFISEQLGRPPVSRVARALLAKRQG